MVCEQLMAWVHRRYAFSPGYATVSVVSYLTCTGCDSAASRDNRARERSCFATSEENPPSSEIYVLYKKVQFHQQNIQYTKLSNQIT